jgi:hypothetical protein
MAHFAELDQNNIVLQVVVISNDDILDENGNESEQKGIDFCKNLYGQDRNWVQTSYNGNFRYKYAAIGDTYNEQYDAFVLAGCSYNEEYKRFLPPIPPQPHPLWWYDPDRLKWRPPFPKPWDTYQYEWDESISNWRQVEGSDGQRAWTLNIEQPEFDRKY